MRERNRAAWQRWRQLVAEQESSGLSVAVFCRERRLNAPQLFAWRRKLRQAEAGSFIEVEVLKTEHAMEVRRQAPGIEVRLGCGRVVVVEAGFDSDHLRAVIVALESITVREPVAWA